MSKKGGINIIHQGFGDNAVFTLVLLAFGGGLALMFFGQKYAPDLYNSVNHTLGGAFTKVQMAIQGKGFYSYPYMPVNTVHGYPPHYQY